MIILCLMSRSILLINKWPIIGYERHGLILKFNITIQYPVEPVTGPLA